MNLGQLTTRANELFGFDLSDAEFAELFNEARREFARRTKYPRKYKSIGPTVAEQAAYSWPTDLLLPLSVKVGTEPVAASDKERIEQYANTNNSELGLVNTRVWYERPDEEGVRKLYIYPTPEEELELILEYVYRPTPLEANEPNAEPTEIPEDFHAHPLYYVAALYYRSVEDNPEFAKAHEETFDLKVADLVRYDFQRRAGNGIFRVPILGQTA